MSLAKPTPKLRAKPTSAVKATPSQRPAAPVPKVGAKPVAKTAVTTKAAATPKTQRPPSVTPKSFPPAAAAAAPSQGNGHTIPGGYGGTRPQAPTAPPQPPIPARPRRVDLLAQTPYTLHKRTQAQVVLCWGKDFELWVRVDAPKKSYAILIGGHEYEFHSRITE